jgi:outer membrane protein assembly factor BamB
MKRLLSLILLLSLVSCAQLKSLNKYLDPPQKADRTFVARWIKNLDPVYDAGNLPIGTSSPLIYEDLLFMGNLKGEMIAYSLDNGREIWKVNEKQPINAKAGIFNDLVIYGTKEGRLFARNYFDGKLVYAIDLNAPIESAPVFQAGRMFIHLRDHRIVSLDAATGKVFWSYKRSVPYPTTLQRVSKVLPYENKIIVGFADGNVSALSMEEGVILWEQRISNGVKFVDVDIEPIYFAGHIVAGSAAGELKFINPKNGVITRSIPLTIQSKPIRLKQTLVVGTVFGEIALIDNTGKIIKRKKLLDSGIGSVALWKKGIIATSMSKDVIFVDPKELSVKSSYDLGHEQSAVFGHIVVQEEHMSFYSSRNRLYVFK